MIGTVWRSRAEGGPGWRHMPFATWIFPAIGIAAFAFHAPDTPERIPDALVYALLLLHTYKAVVCFDPLLKPSVELALLDAAIGLFFVALAWSMGTAIAFPLFLLCLFVVDLPRYGPRSARCPAARGLFQRKSRIVAGAAWLTGLCLVLAVAGYPLLAAWTGAAMSTVCNVLLLVIAPVYQRPESSALPRARRP